MKLHFPSKQIIPPARRPLTPGHRDFSRRGFLGASNLLALLAVCCGVALAGCVSTDRQMSRSSLEGKNLQRDEAPSPTGLHQPVIPDERGFRKLDLNTNEAVTLDKWQDFETNVEAKEKLSTLDENHLQLNWTKFLTQAPKHSQPCFIFGGSDQTNNNDWERQEFQPQGLRLFTIHF